MAYQKQTWTDRNVESPRTYTMVENQDGTVTLIPAPGTVTAEGTPVSAARMNHIEDGIDGAVCKSGDTMTGNLETSGGNIWAGNSPRTTDANMGVRNNKGEIFLFSESDSNGQRGIWVKNAGGTGKAALNVDQNNNVTLNGSTSGWETLSNVTWNKTFVSNIALYQNHTVCVQMTIGSNGAVSGDILAVLPTNAKCRVFVPIVYADGASNALGGSGMAYIEGNSKNIIISKASVPANSYMNISMVIPVE